MVGCTCLWYRLVGAWLMHLFMVQFDYRLRYRLMHGSGLLLQVYNGISYRDNAAVVSSLTLIF